VLSLAGVVRAGDVVRRPLNPGKALSASPGTLGKGPPPASPSMLFRPVTVPSLVAQDLETPGRERRARRRYRLSAAPYPGHAKGAYVGILGSKTNGYA
jgi:hypothetical protein